MIGQKILELRKKNNLSQEKLAESIGVSRQTISNYIFLTKIIYKITLEVAQFFLTNKKYRRFLI